mgnify:FL=1
MNDMGNSLGSDIDIMHIAKLARLKIDEEELERYKSEMTDIIKMVEEMPDIAESLELDADNAMELRKDSLEECGISRDEILKNAPKVVAGCVVVPKTVD